ncbi:Uncharacterized membrane protein YfcA [Paracoccus isoporae]|uniref:Probable membrane transporter protein n=1 Tax=Paracoccus isoporae TaxID=591205 RepID=A0A1G7GI74_9RHOB|nr:sulfite exporter TauE/SafE family protein [Paracoccus isoporae]SDE87868.1 Uncharacterized membrane protein YfcA [Paracoccus isoporae]
MELILLILPEGMSPPVLYLLLAVSFAASFITVAFGIGGGGILLAAMATLVPPAALIPTHGVIQIGSNLGRVMLTFRHIFWPALPGFAAGSVIGAAIGGSVAVNLPPEWVQLGVGGFILWSVLGRAPRAVRDWPLTVGVISSVLTMFFGASGLFVAVFTKAQTLPRHAHVATHAALMTLQHAIKTVTFGMLGFAFAGWLPFLAAMIVAGFAGTLAGKTLLNRIDDRRFKLALDVILILLSLRLTYAGMRDLLR